MTLLERLKEPLLGPCLGGGAEILKGSGNIRYYIDFPGIKGGSVDVSIAIADKLNALPALIAVAEAAGEVNDYLGKGCPISQIISRFADDFVASGSQDGLVEKGEALQAALAKLEGEAPHED